MMFRRRHKLHPIQTLREYVWPRAGWRRTSLYLMHRLSRLPETPYSIAAGFACGAAISVTPFVGFHFMLAALIAWLIGGNILAAAVGTAVGNPWTFPFIWYWIYHFGNWILGGEAAGHLPGDLTLGYMWDHPGLVLLPMAVGSIPTAIMAWAVAYWPVFELVKTFQARRRRRLAAARTGDEPPGVERRRWARRAEDREAAERRRWTRRAEDREAAPREVAAQGPGERRVADRRAAEDTVAEGPGAGETVPGRAAGGGAAAQRTAEDRKAETR